MLGRLLRREQTLSSCASRSAVYATATSSGDPCETFHLLQRDAALGDEGFVCGRALVALVLTVPFVAEEDVYLGEVHGGRLELRKSLDDRAAGDCDAEGALVRDARCADLRDCFGHSRRNSLVVRKHVHFAPVVESEAFIRR